MRTARLAAAVASLAAGGALASPAAAVVPGSNGRISFDRAVGPGPPQGNIWSIGADGSAAALLQGGPRTQTDAAWSPDGRRLAFMLQTTAKPDGPTEIALMNADGTGTQQLTRLGSDAIAPSWTPDGRILFVSNHQSRRGLRQSRNGPPPPLWVYVMNADGTGITRLVRTRRGVGGGECVDPVMAPDGSQIALYCVTFGKDAPANGGIYLTGPGGGAIRRLSPNNGPEELNPAWSPDSRRLAFETGYVIDPRPGRRRSDIAIMNRDGSRVRTIARTRWFETNPVFSPDGTRIAFTSDRDTKPRTPRGGPRRLNRGFELYTANVDGTGVTRLTRNTSPDVFPDWGVAPAR